MAGRSNRGRRNDDNSLRWNQIRDKAASDSRNAGKPTQSKTQTNTANTQGRSGQTARGTSSGTKTQTNTANTQGRSGQTARGTSAPQNTVKPQSTAPRQNVSMAPPTSGKGFSGGLSATQAMTKGLPAVAPMDALTRAAYMAAGNQTAADYRRTAGGLSDNSAAGQMLRDRAGFIRNLSAADQALPDEARNTVAAAKNQYSMLGQNIVRAAQAKAKLGSAGMDTGDIDRYINSARAYQRHLHDVADLARSTQGYTGGVRGNSYNPMQMPDELKDVAADSSHWVNTARGNANDTFDVDENRNLSRTRWQDDTPELLENLRQQLAYADMLERTGNGAQAAEIRARVQEIADAQRLPASWDVRAQDVLASAGNKIAGSLISAGSMAAQATENMTGNVNRSDRAYQLKTALDDANARLRKARVRGDAQAEQKWQSEVERLSLLLYGEQEYDENGNLREEWIDSRVIPAWHGESGVSERGHELLTRSARQMAEAKRGLSGEAQYAMDTVAMGLENAPMLGLYAINPVLGSAYMAATVEGQMADSFSHSVDANGNEYNNGMSAQEALLRAAPYAAVETATEALGDSALLDFINKRGSLGLGGVMMRSFLTEGAEETTAGALDYGLDYIYGNPAVRDQSAMEVIGDWLDQGLQGGIIGAALGGTGAVAANRINGQAPQLDPEWWKDVYTGYSSSYSDRLNEGDLRTVQDYVRSLGEEWQRQQTQGERITIPEELYEQRITPEPIAEVQPAAEPQAEPTPAPAPSPAPVQAQNAQEGMDTAKTENAQENAPVPAQSAPYNPFAVGGTVQYNGHQYEILETPNAENRNMFRLKNTDGAHGGTLSIPRSEIRRENQNLLRANDELESAPAPVQERAEPAPAAELENVREPKIDERTGENAQNVPDLTLHSGISEEGINRNMESIRSAADELGIEQNPAAGAQDTVQQVRQNAPVTLEQAERSMDTIRSIAGNNNFGETGAKAFREGYEIGQDSLEYFRDFSRVYNAVLSGSTRQDTGTLTTAQVKAALDAARADRAAADNRYSKGKRSADPGLFYGEWEEENIPTDTHNAIHAIAENLGLTVRFDEYEGGNGYINGTTVVINRAKLKDDADIIEFIAGHEFTHRLQTLAPKEYRELRNLALNSPGIENVIELELRANPDIDRAEAIDEAVADYVGRLIYEEELLERFARVASRSLLEKVVDFLDKVLRNLARMVTRYQETDVDRAIDVLERVIDSGVKNVKTLEVESGEDIEMDAGERHSAVSLFSAISITAERDADTHLITYKDADGNAIEKVTPAMIENSGMGALIKCAVEVGSITQKQAKQQAKDLADVYNLVMQTSDSEMVWEWVGATLFSAMKSNSDAQYSTTVDFSTVCRKTVEMLEAVSAAMQELGRGLSKDEITDIQLKLIEEAKKNGQDPIVPCPVCYVFSRWAGVGGILDNIKRYQEKYPLTMQDAEIHAAIRRLQNSTKADIRNELHEYDAEYRDLEQQNELLAVSLKEARKVRDSLKRDTPERREAARNVNTLAAEKSRVTKQMKAMVDAGTPELAWLQRVRMEQDGLTGNWVTRAGYADEWSGLSVKERDDILFNLMDAESFSQAAPLTWSYRTTRGPSAGKAILPYSDMRIGDIILGVKNSASGKATFQNVSGELTKDQRKAWKNAVSRARAQNLIGGQRYQSTSDFRYDYALDYLQSFFELQAIGGNIQTYTKIIEYADMIGSMGGDANVSVMPLNRGYDEDGNLLFSPVTGVPIEAARAVSERYDSVQPILVGINDEHIRLALESDYITFVIPYHASGASINDFIAKLVSNLDESFNELNYFDYSGNQTDSPAKKPTAAQARLRDLRTKLLTKPSTEILDEDGNQILGKDFKPLKKKWEPSAEDIAFMRGMADSAKSIRGRSYEKLREIEKKALGGNRKAIEEYLSWSAGSLWDIYQRLWNTDYYRGVSLSSAQAKSIMPHEYWDRKSKIGNAHINGFIFRSYCFSMGITPRFSTELTKNYVDENGDKQSVKYGDLSQYPGYWKVLIDRAMYDLKGNYRDQNAINLTGFDKARLTPDYNRQGYLSELPTVQEPDSSRASRAAERFVEEKSRRNSSVNYADLAGNRVFEERGSDDAMQKVSEKVKEIREFGKVTQITDEEIGKMAFLMQESEKKNAAFLSNLVRVSAAGDIYFDSDGMNIPARLTRDGRGHISRFNSYNEENSVILSKIKECAQNSEYAFSENDDSHTNAENVEAWDVFVGAIDVGERKFYIVFKLRKMLNEKKHQIYSAVIKSDAGEYAKKESHGLSAGHGQVGDDIASYEISGLSEDRIPETSRDVNRQSALSYADLIEQFGSIKPGENPARDIKVPRRTSEDDKVDQTIRSVLESSVTTEELIPTIQKLIEDGMFSYDPYTDRQAIYDAEREIEDADGDARDFYYQWSEKINAGQVSKKLTAQGWAIYNAAATAGDTKLAIRVLTDIVYHQRNAAQAVQATRILKQLSPSAQLYGVTRTVERFNEELENEHGFAANNKNRRRRVEETMDDLDRRRDDLLDRLEDMSGETESGTGSTVEDIGRAMRGGKRRGKRGTDSETQEEVEPKDWVADVADALERAMYARTKPQNAKKPTIEQTALKDLIAFADQYVARRKGDRKPRTAIDRIRDFYTYRSEYARAWNQAIAKYRQEHGEESAAMDAMEDWLNGTIAYAGQGNDKVLLSAVAQAALDGDVKLRNIVRRAAIGDRQAVENEIYTRLADAIGPAARENEQQLRGAVSRWVKEQMDSRPVDVDAMLQRDMRQAVKDAGKTIAGIIRSGRKDRDALGRAIAGSLVKKYGISEYAAQDIADRIVTSWNETMAAEAQKALANRFRSRDDRQVIERSIADRLTELGNLGAFSDPQYRIKASNAILKGDYNIALNESLVDQFLAAGSETERQDILIEIYKDVGRQMPATLADKFNALRYLAMLGNARTHIRNLFGNAVFAPVVMSKNMTAMAIERMIPAEKRTKGIPTPELMKAASEDYANVRPAIMRGGKYVEKDGMNDYIDQGRRIFKNPIFEFLRVKNGEALDAEDSWFARPHYAIALAQYCAARGISAEAIRSGQGDEIQAARTYAMNEAAKGTYRDTNAFSDFISNVGRYRGDNKFAQGASYLMSGILPFRKTPANIAVRAIEYSPLGVFRTVGSLIDCVRTGNTEPAQVVDQLAAMTTGTVLAATGMYLAWMGILKAADPDDDDDLNKFRKDMGHQEWAIEWGGYSVTIDWLAPECIPLLMGANFMEKFSDGGSLFQSALNAFNSIAEPFLEMSMLSSVQDTLDSVSGWDTGNASSLVTVVANAATNLLTQVVPALAGQGERASQENRMANWSKTGSTLSVAGREIELPDFLPDDWKYVIAKNSAKIPGIDFNQYEYVDVWGRAQSNGGFLARIVNNFINPAYVRKIDDDAVNAYIENLYPAGREAGVNVIPTRAAYKITVDGEDIELDKDQYHTYAVSVGQNRFSLVQTAMADKAFMALPDTEQAEIIGKLYSYADYLGKLDVLPKEQRDTLIAKTSEGSNKWLTQAQDAQKAGISPIALVMVRNAVNNVSGWHDSKGNAVSNSAGLQQMDAINKAFSSTKAREWAYDNMGDIGKTIRGYNPAKVQEELAKARKSAVDAG